MTERMTDSSIVYDWRLVQNKTDATEQTAMAQTRLEDELSRARASEKALADALISNGYVRSGYGLWHTDCCNEQNDGSASCFESCTQARTTLRLAGRLP